jgi:hypothetical protein
MAGPVAGPDPDESEHARPVTRGELHAMLDSAGVHDLAGLARALRRGKSGTAIGVVCLALGAGAGAGGTRAMLPNAQPDPQPSATSPATSQQQPPSERPAETEHEGPDQPRRQPQSPEQCEAARAQCEAADASDRRCTREARRVVSYLDLLADECGIEPARLVAREREAMPLPADPKER